MAATERDARKTYAGVEASTRRQLTRMYGERLDVPRPHESERAVRKAPSAPSRQASVRTRRVRHGIGVLAAAGVISFVGAHALSIVRGGQDSAVRADATTPADELPWKDATFGSLTLSLPGAPDVSSRGADARGVSTYARYDLPGVSITLTASGREGSITSGEALRQAGDGLAQSYGRAVLDVSTDDLGWATTLTARIAGPAGETRVYVVVTASEVLQLTADMSSAPSDREARIFQRIVRSVQPA